MTSSLRVVKSLFSARLSWILASIILIADLVLLLFSAISPYFPKGGGEGPPSGLLLMVLLLILASPLFLPIPFCLLVVRPRMREIYKDSRFLYSLPKQALLYIVAVLLYLLATGVLEGILSGGRLAPF